MLDKIRFVAGRKFIVNELAYFVAKYTKDYENAIDIGSKMVCQRKLETVGEIAERFQIGKEEIGL